MKKYRAILCLFGIFICLPSFKPSIAAEYVPERRSVGIVMPVRTTLIANCSTPYHAQRWCEEARECCGGVESERVDSVEILIETLGAEDADVTDTYQGRSIAVFM